MKQSVFSVASVVLAATVAAVATPAMAQSDQIVREGSGERRQALNAMELSTFDRSLLEGLTDWIGEPVTADSIDGKPVLILTWASWHSGSTASARAAQLMARSYGAQGLVVIGVHADEGYDGAAATAERLRLNFPIARDAGSAFRKAIKADMDPNFYVIDRAGQIRFADVERGSIRRAVSLVAEESREQAENASGRRMASNQPQGRVIMDVSSGDVANIPEWNIPTPDALLYDDADWPARWLFAEEEFDADFRRRDGNELPTINLDSSLVRWLTPKPNLDGRVRVVYYWSHNFPLSYERIQPLMDEVQRRHGRDVAVIGAAVPVIFVDRDEVRRDSGIVDEAIERFATNLQNIMTRTKINHSIVFDSQWELHSTSLGNSVGRNPRFDRMSEKFAAPLVVLYSSDNKVRWLGSPLHDFFEQALNQMVDVDPAVQDRRRRDAAFLTRQGN
ncbi:MAG: TlpA disulfide reductase family protein [Planctomycetota bacterium]